MIQIIKKGGWINTSQNVIQFYNSDLGYGYSFDCDENWNVIVERLTREGHKNYQKCLDGIPGLVKTHEVFTESVYQPPLGKCSCGLEVVMETRDVYGVVSCVCGKTYNRSGQELRPKSEWEERLD